MKNGLSDSKNTKKIKKDGLFMKICVILTFVIVTVYAYSHLYLSFLNGSEVAPASSGLFYAFFTGEAGYLTFLKYKKRKAKNEGGAEIDGEDTGNDFNDDHSISD